MYGHVGGSLRAYKYYKAQKSKQEDFVLETQLGVLLFTHMRSQTKFEMAFEAALLILTTWFISLVLLHKSYYLFFRKMNAVTSVGSTLALFKSVGNVSIYKILYKKYH